MLEMSNNQSSNSNDEPVKLPEIIISLKRKPKEGKSCFTVTGIKDFLEDHYVDDDVPAGILKICNYYMKLSENNQTLTIEHSEILKKQLLLFIREKIDEGKVVKK